MAPALGHSQRFVTLKPLRVNYNYIIIILNFNPASCDLTLWNLKP